jgi:hypothetical protein
MESFGSNGAAAAIGEDAIRKCGHTQGRAAGVDGLIPRERPPHE